MASVSISEARQRLADVVEQAGEETVFLERRGVPAAVLVSPARYAELLEAFEEAEDVAAFDDALRETAPNLPWEQVKADLGWA